MPCKESKEKKLVFAGLGLTSLTEYNINAQKIIFWLLQWRAEWANLTEKHGEL